ncbi:hypothetical protein [Aquamicrobium sp.]|uniref:hypothetical protein n=1 Tax=Aquamicrobium sp. TaxID=1872579 RepID=UPI00258CB89A|nr:hypothetical protein [Aquamicrobium sp.]MCK9549283.1 hypothetical protein [Aquamicrobium sp.]
MIKKYIFLNLIFTAMIFAQECVIDYRLMYTIASNERHHKKPIGYPYLISFNKPSQKKVLPANIRSLMLDGRTIDCKNSNTCVQILTYLSQNGVKNLDLGAFQINYMYHGKKASLASFFNLKESYDIARDLAEIHVKKHGCTWKSLARYHSATQKYNQRYTNNLKKNYMRSYNE